MNDITPFFNPGFYPSNSGLPNKLFDVKVDGNCDGIHYLKMDDRLYFPYLNKSGQNLEKKNPGEK